MLKLKEREREVEALNRHLAENVLKRYPIDEISFGINPLVTMSCILPPPLPAYPKGPGDWGWGSQWGAMRRSPPPQHPAELATFHVERKWFAQICLHLLREDISWNGQT